MLYEAATDNVLKKLKVADACQGYRAIIGWAWLVYFFVNRCHIGSFPSVWEALLVARGFEK